MNSANKIKIATTLMFLLVVAPWLMIQAKKPVIKTISKNYCLEKVGESQILLNYRVRRLTKDENIISMANMVNNLK